MLNSLTEFDAPTIFGHRFGTLTEFSILAILGIIFEIKRPNLENGRKFRTALITGISTLVIFAINIISLQFIESSAGIHRVLVGTCFGEIFIGIVHPYLYITGKPNLKAYIYNVIHMRILQPMNEIINIICAFSSCCTNEVQPEGRVEFTNIQNLHGPQIIVTVA